MAKLYIYENGCGMELYGQEKAIITVAIEKAIEELGATEKTLELQKYFEEKFEKEENCYLKTETALLLHSIIEYANISKIVNIMELIRGNSELPILVILNKEVEFLTQEDFRRDCETFERNIGRSPTEAEKRERLHDYECRNMDRLRDCIFEYNPRTLDNHLKEWDTTNIDSFNEMIIKVVEDWKGIKVVY